MIEGARPGGPATRIAAALALVIAVLASLLSVGGSAEGRTTKTGHDGRPNILVVMTDDMSTDDLQFMPNVRHLLADKGTTFADAIDSYPLCCPARATFITGQYAHNHKVKGNFAPYGWYGMKDRKNILPAWLQKAGYRTSLIGKWLNGYGALDAHGEVPHGFTNWRGLLDVSAYDYFNYVMNSDGKLRFWGDKSFAKKLVKFALIEVDDQPDSIGSIYAKLQELFGDPPYTYWGNEKKKDYSPDVTGRITQRRLRSESKAKKPFFVWWAPAAPHREDVSTTLMGRPGPDPRPAPRYAQKSTQYDLPQPPSFNEADVDDKSSNLKNAAPLLSQAKIDQLKLDYQGRAGSLLAVDDHVKRMVKLLRKTHQLNNTMIVFVSDNGWLQGEHRIPGDKFLPFDESLRVPFIVRGPGIPKGATVHGQVSNIDFAPTLLDAAKAKPGRKVDGLSLMPTVRHHKKRPNRALEIEALRPLFVGAIPVNGWDRPYHGARTDRYTYVVWTETGEKELYDRRSDPYELKNVVDDPGYAQVRGKLAAKLVKLVHCKGAWACSSVKP